MRFIIEGTQEELKAFMTDGIVLGIYDGSESEDCEECECEDDKVEKIARKASLKIEFCNAVGDAVEKLMEALE